MSNMVVNTNVLAFNSHRNLKKTGVNQSKASARLSSGMRINSAADDAAGLAISEKMRGQIRGLDMASKNSQDGISLVQTAEGGMQEVTNMVQRIRELTVQAANDTNEAEDRTKIDNEIGQLLEEIDAMAGRVEFNKKTLMDGSFTSDDVYKSDGNGKIIVDAAKNGDRADLYLQVGANATQQIKFNVGQLDTAGLGLAGFSINKKQVGFDGSDVESLEYKDLVAADSPAKEISNLLEMVDFALSKVTDERASLGAIQNRLEYTINSLDISSENLSASESRIRDTDMAKEMMNLTKYNVLQQAATSMLAQANQAPQNVLQLLQ